MRRYIIKATNNFELETNELLEAQKVLANESTKNFNETFTVIRIDGNNEKILVQGKVIEPEEQKKLSDFIWNYKKEKCEMIKLIVRDKEIGGEKKLVEVNNISDIATIKFDEEDEEVTYQYCNIDINNPKLENSKHLSDIWKSLKDDAKKLTLFEFVDKIFLSQDFIFRLSETYEQDGKLILPIALEPYAEEAIVYVINSCINGKIDGYFKIEKATNDMMRFAKRRNNEMKYLDWQNDIIDMVAHDFRSNGYYGIVAMEKLIKELQNKNLEDAKNKTIDFLFNDEDMLKYIYLSNSMTENKVSLSFYTNSLGDKFIKREPKSIYRDFVIYKNIPVYKMEISASFYEIEIDENGFDVRKELSKEQIELVIGK